MENTLKPRQQKFIHEYSSNGGNATRAAQVAGYGNGNSYSRLAGHRLITNDNISESIKMTSEANGLSMERILERLSIIIEKGKDSDSIQAIKVWSDLTGSSTPARMSLLNSVMKTPRTPEEIDFLLEKMRGNKRG